MATDSKLTLSRDEVKDLCGTPMKARQLAFLVKNGIRHYKGLDGWPRVLRSTVEGAAAALPQPGAAGWKPNKVA